MIDATRHTFTDRITAHRLLPLIPIFGDYQSNDIPQSKDPATIFPQLNSASRLEAMGRSSSLALICPRVPFQLARSYLIMRFATTVSLLSLVAVAAAQNQQYVHDLLHGSVQTLQLANLVPRFGLVDLPSTPGGVFTFTPPSVQCN